MMSHSHRRRAALAAILVATFAASVLFCFRSKDLSSSLRGRRLLSLSQLTDPKSVSRRSDAADDAENLYAYDMLRSGNAIGTYNGGALSAARENCQFVFVIGVEGTIHHGFAPILHKMAVLQVGRETALSNVEDKANRQFATFKRAIFSANGRPTNEEVANTMGKLCPNDGRKHIYLDGKSWPSGLGNRDPKWKDMTPLEISVTETARNEPMNLYDVVDAYSPYADIKFVVLHRPYLATVASHKKWDGGAMGHSNVLRGHMLLLREFLDTHMYDRASGARLWTVLCTEQIMSKNYETEEEAAEARGLAIRHLAYFLGWKNALDCPDCFDGWRESTKDPLKALGTNTVQALFDHMKSLVGVWPPIDETMTAEQVEQCRL